MADKQWYYDAVVARIILKGYSREVSEQMVECYHLKEKLDTFPDVQMHYDIESVVQEIFARR